MALFGWKSAEDLAYWGRMPDWDAVQKTAIAITQAEARGRIAGLREAAAFIKQHVPVQSNQEDAPSYFSTRRGGNDSGLEYATAINALIPGEKA